MNTTRTLLALSLVSGLPVFAQLRPGPSPGGNTRAHANEGPIALAPRGFEENKGQVTTLNGEPAPFVKYRFTDGGTNIFLLGNGIAYQFNRVRYPEGYRDALTAALRDPRRSVPEELRAEVRIEACRLDMELAGADPQARITTNGRSADHTNYCNRGALDVRSFTEVTYHEVYPGIDRVVRVSGAGIEQDFIVRPGGDPSRIRMRFTHQEELRLDGTGGLVFGNRSGRFQEQPPTSLQGGKAVETRFVVEGNTVGFGLGAYDRRQPLVIDPPLQWATYYGAANDDQSQACALDAAGNVYLTGWSNSTSGIASSGGYQEAPGGQYDGMIVKLNADGARVWATYYGGEADDAFRGAAVDADGNIYASGITSSQEDIAFNMPGSTYGGAIDALLVKLDSTGLPQWGMYYGGEGEDRGRWCSLDGQGNVYMTGLTASIQNISTTPCHQPVPGGFQDAFLVKFNPEGARQWGTYYGGGSDEQAMGCATDASGNTCITGGTGTSSGAAIATAGSHQDVFGAGGADAFLAKFDTDGNRLWGTYYGGDGSDFGFACGLDPSGNVFTTGDTFTGNGTSIASEGAHQGTNGGGCDAYVAKFTGDGVRQWGTYYGGIANDFGRGCFSDSHGTTYSIGETESSTNISTPGAYQETFGGAPVDVFMARFHIDGSRAFGTYYGGEAQDYASTGAIDSDGNTYLLGVTGSQTAISTADVYQPTLGGGTDAFLAKFDAPLDCFGEPNGGALPVTPCDDDDGCTTNDTWSHECVCAGTFQDADADGQCDAEDPCPALAFLTTGDPCDDGNADTGNDTVNGNCACFGVLPVDCAGVPDGSAQPGTACDDADPCTIDDLWDLACACAGTFQDADGDGVCDAQDTCPDVPGQIGDACDDADACTVNDLIDINCACAGTHSPDTDGDGLCDAIDPCPLGASTIPGATCDDADICTTGDVITTDCVCAGAFQDTDSDGICDAEDNCPEVAGQIGEACDDGEPCTADDVLNADCACTGTPLEIAGITGEDWVVEGNTYTWNIAPVPDATIYAWALPTGWSTATTGQTELVATVGNTAGDISLCVTVVIGDCDLTTCIDVQVSLVGIAEAGNTDRPWYTVRPNPSADDFILTRAEGVAGPVTFTVLDATGRTIAAPSAPAGARTTLLDMRQASPGVYFLRIARNAETQVLRLMVRR